MASIFVAWNFIWVIRPLKRSTQDGIRNVCQLNDHVDLASVRSVKHVDSSPLNVNDVTESDRTVQGRLSSWHRDHTHGDYPLIQ